MLRLGSCLGTNFIKNNRFGLVRKLKIINGNVINKRLYSSHDVIYNHQEILFYTIACNSLTCGILGFFMGTGTGNDLVIGFSMGCAGMLVGGILAPGLLIPQCRVIYGISIMVILVSYWKWKEARRDFKPDRDNYEDF